MKHERITPRGGAPVGLVAELPLLETGFVLYLRLWYSGDAHQEQVSKDFTLALGADRGTRAVQCFARLCDLCLRYGRRPLMRHQINCACLGADESCLANFVAMATDGEREDAMFIATLLVPPDLTPELTSLAQDVGLAIRQMLARDGRDLSHHLKTLH